MSKFILLTLLTAVGGCHLPQSTIVRVEVKTQIVCDETIVATSSMQVARRFDSPVSLTITK